MHIVYTKTCTHEHWTPSFFVALLESNKNLGLLLLGGEMKVERSIEDIGLKRNLWHRYIKEKETTALIMLLHRSYKKKKNYAIAKFKINKNMTKVRFRFKII